jgi:hypothetical protein
MMILIISKLAGCKVGGKLKIRGNEVLISESGILFGIPKMGYCQAQSYYVPPQIVGAINSMILFLNCQV